MFKKIWIPTKEIIVIILKKQKLTLNTCKCIIIKKIVLNEVNNIIIIL